MKTHEQARQELSDFLAEIGELVDHLTTMDAAQRAWSPGATPVEALSRIIAAETPSLAA